MNNPDSAMAAWCPNCGRQIDDDEKFCRQCGMPQELNGEEATTWMLSPDNVVDSGKTRRVTPPTTGQGGAPTSAAYLPPQQYYGNPAPNSDYVQPPPHPGYAPPPSHPAPVYPSQQVGTGRISLGQWLTDGWQVYKANWALMSVATLIAIAISAGTLGILAGPLLMGLFQMAFKTMRGEQPVMSDLFNWKGKFLQAFLGFLVFFVAHIALAGLSNASTFFNLIYLALLPMFAIMLSQTMTNLLERRLDAVAAINEVTRTVFSRNWLSWWLVGLVMVAITAGGFFTCGVGGLVTLPWMICAGAVLHKDTYGFDDPNRTNQ